MGKIYIDKKREIVEVRRSGQRSGTSSHKEVKGKRKRWREMREHERLIHLD